MQHHIKASISTVGSLAIGNSPSPLQSATNHCWQWSLLFACLLVLSCQPSQPTTESPSHRVSSVNSVNCHRHFGHQSNKQSRCRVAIVLVTLHASIDDRVTVGDGDTVTLLVSEYVIRHSFNSFNQSVCLPACSKSLVIHFHWFASVIQNRRVQHAEGNELQSFSADTDKPGPGSGSGLIATFVFRLSLVGSKIKARWCATRNNHVLHYVTRLLHYYTTPYYVTLLLTGSHDHM